MRFFHAGVVAFARDHAVAAIEDHRFPFDGSHLDWQPDGQRRTLPDGPFRNKCTGRPG